MKSLTIGFLVIQGIVVLLMGGYLFNLQARIDELFFVLPLDREGGLDSPLAGRSELANEAVIETMNARIDNLADTIELIANSQRGDGKPVNGDGLFQPGSGKSRSVESTDDNQVAAIEDREARTQELSSKIDNLERSIAKINRIIGATGSLGKDSDNSRNSTLPTRVPVNDRAASPAGLKIAKMSGSAVSREKEKRSGSMPRHGSLATENAPADGEWSVNLMSLTDESIARKQLQELLEKGVSAAIKRTELAGKTWYRVQVSGFKSKQQAQEYQESVAKKLRLPGAWVTR